MTTISQSINNQKVSIRWREQYVTEGINKKVLPLPRGVYRGFWFNDQSPPTDRLVLSIEPLTPIGLDLRSVVVIEDQVSGYSVTITEDELAGVAVDVSTFLGDPAEVILYVWIEAEYTTGAETTASYYVSDSALAVPTDGAIFLGALTVPAAAVVIDMNVCTADYADRDTPQAKKVESADDYVAGDLQYGMMSGVDRYTLITPNQKDAIEASVFPSAANEMVTQSVLDGVDTALSAGIVANTAAIVENDGEIADNAEAIEDLEQSTLPPWFTKADIASKLVTKDGATSAGWGHMWSPVNSITAPSVIPGDSQLLDIAVAFVGADEATRLLVVDKFYKKLYVIDPVTQNDQTYSFAATQSPMAICSDGTYAYVVVQDETVTPPLSANLTHALRCFEITESGADNRIGWPEAGVTLTGIGLASSSADDYWFDYSNRVIIANNDFVAIMASWVDDSVQDEEKIQFVRRDSPVHVGGAHGDGSRYDPSWGGGMASNGEVLVFGSFEGDYGDAGSIDISDIPTSITSGAAYGPFPISQTSEYYVVDIVFTGSYWVMMWADYDILFTSTEHSAGEDMDEMLGSDVPINIEMGGGMVFDGMRLWVHSMVADGATYDFSAVHCIDINGFTARDEDNTKQNVYQGRYITDEFEGVRGTASYGEPHHGRLVFDGQDIWVILDRRTGGNLSGLIRRIPRARNRG